MGRKRHSDEAAVPTETAIASSRYLVQGLWSKAAEIYCHLASEMTAASPGRSSQLRELAKGKDRVRAEGQHEERLWT